MRFPGQINKVIPGLGRILGHGFNLEEEIKVCKTRLDQDAEVAKVMQMPGWKTIRREYGQLISNQLGTIRQLCKKAHRFTDEIQERSDLMEACETWLRLMAVRTEDMETTAKRLDRLRREQAKMGVA